MRRWPSRGSNPGSVSASVPPSPKTAETASVRLEDISSWGPALAGPTSVPQAIERLRPEARSLGESVQRKLFAEFLDFALDSAERPVVVGRPQRARDEAGN